MQTLNVDEIGDNFSRYFSAKYGRPNDKLKGTAVTLFPWDEDLFVLRVKLPRVSESVGRNESEDAKKIEFDSVYSLSEGSLSPVLMRDVKLLWKGKEIKVPVRIQLFSAKRTLDNEDLQYARTLEGKKVDLTVMVDLDQELSVFSSGQEVRYMNASDLQRLIEFLEKEPQAAKSRWENKVSEIAAALLAQDKKYQELQSEREALEGKLASHKQDSKEWKNTNKQLERANERLTILGKEAESKAREKVGAFNDAQFQVNQLLSHIVFVVPVVIEEVNGVSVGR
jgi:hypothetical protein